MKKVIPFLLLFTFFLINCYAQDPATQNLSKDELKLLKLKEKVASIEEKIRVTEEKITQADSLIEAGEIMVDEANNEIKIITEEEKIFEKENEAERKALVKQLKKADDDEVKSIEADIKKLESEYKTKIKEFDKLKVGDRVKLNERGKDFCKRFSGFPKRCAEYNCPLAKNLNLSVVIKEIHHHVIRFGNFCVAVEAQEINVFKYKWRKL